MFIFVFGLGVEMPMSAVNELLDSGLSSDFVKRFKEEVMSFEGVCGCFMSLFIPMA